jgi:hypothetical protein
MFLIAARAARRKAFRVDEKKKPRGTPRGFFNGAGERPDQRMTNMDISGM